MHDLANPPRSDSDDPPPSRGKHTRAASETSSPTPPTGAGEETLTQFDGLSALVRMASPVAERVRGLTGPLPAIRVPDAGGFRNMLLRVPWLLLGILAVQAALSLRLVWTDTPEQDEALYLWSGHMEWAHWLNGTPIPPFSTFFSGAPIVYPPLSAIADAIGGFAGARILSLVFMLGATALLWGTASRLYNRRVAFFAAGIWSVLGPTAYLGAYATFDAMSLFLIALGAWCAVRAGTRRDETMWMVATAGAVALANAAKYASALFDPVVIVLAILVAIPHGVGRKFAFMRGAAVFAYVTAILVLLLTIGGGRYVTGVNQTTLSRAGVGDSVTSVLRESWSLTGVVIVASVIGAVWCYFSKAERHLKLLTAAFALAGLLVPAEQARIHTLTSLNKHLDFGAWFAAIAVGYAVDRVVSVPPWKLARAAAAVLFAGALALPARAGAAQSKQIFSWPNSTQFIGTLAPFIKHTTGPVLVETPYVSESYLANGTEWQRWSNTRSIRLPTGDYLSVQVAKQGQPLVYAKFIKSGYFKLIALNFQGTPALDQFLFADLNANSAYRVVASVPYGATHYVIWEYEPVQGGGR